MKKKIILGITVVVVVLGVAGFVIVQRNVQHIEIKVPDPFNFSWLIKVSGCDSGSDDCNPKSEVSLLNESGSKTYFSTTYPEGCSQKDELKLKENEITGIFCWWAGGGHDVGVFKEEGRFILKETFIDEVTGELVTIKEIEL